jgi:hypothetical protein
LWNLLPAHQQVNNQKRDRVPSADLLRRRQSAIQGWWENAYCVADQPMLQQTFEAEARATLPTVGASLVVREDVFSGLMLQQMRLRHDQQAPLWDGA